MNADQFPDKIGASSLARSLTFSAWNERSCRLANALRGLGLGQGDRIAVLAYNCLEWMEIYVAVAKAALVLVPINFRLVGSEVEYIVENSEAKAVIVQHDLLEISGHGPGRRPDPTANVHTFRRPDAGGVSILRGPDRSGRGV